ncbi:MULTISPECIES: PseG/SpsG family protein [unclassified Paenibacillus]|uniref:PseG/SpsG family protein n=1 Tax=unclassified Paenibacillus TaxID=185978 RepID=UPI00362CF366
MNIKILVGASKNIGLGHLSRCGMLASFMGHNDLKIELYVLRDPSPGNQVELNYPIVSYEEFYQLCTRNCPEAIIFDMPLQVLRLEFIQKIKKLGIQTIIFDDDGELCDKDYCSILISCSVKFLNIDSNIIRKGPNYILLNPSFREIRKKEKLINNEIKKVLLSFGGSDPNQITLKVLSMFRGFSDYSFDITVVLGKLSDELPPNLLESHLNVKVLRNVLNMSEQLVDTDLAILSGGMTMYEACCVGTPAIIISQNQQQNQEASYLHQQGCVINAGMHDHITEPVLNKVIKELQDKNVRMQLSQYAAQLVDGEGLARVTNIVKDVLK